MNAGHSLAVAGRVPWAQRSSDCADESAGPQQISLTAAAAGFFFSFRTVLVLMTARWLHIGSEPGVISSLVVGFLLLLAVIFQSIGPAKQRPGQVLCMASFRWVLLYLGFSCFSLAWSGTVSVVASFLYWSSMAADVAIVVLLLRTGPVAEMSHSIMKGFICSSCLLAAIAWGMPAAGDLRLGDQEYFNTNQIGNLCAVGVFMAEFLARRKDGRRRIAMFFLTLTLLRSLSKTTLVAFVVSQGLLLIDNSMSRKMKVLLVVAALSVVIAFWGLFDAYYSVYTSESNQAESLTGRTAIWALSLSAALERPWTGNGIDAMWKVFPPFGNDLFEPRHAENEVLQQFFSYGVVGIVMLAGLYGSLHRRIRGMQKGPSRTILLSMLLFVVIRGLAEAEPIDLLLPLWMITLIGAIIIGLQEANRDSVHNEIVISSVASTQAGFRPARRLLS